MADTGPSADTGQSADTGAFGWLIERGIGETRALQVRGGEVIAAKLYWPGELTAGTLVTARLTTKRAGARRGTAVIDVGPMAGTELLVDHLPAEATEGAVLSLRINRAAIAERGRLKRAQARFAAGDVPKKEAVNSAPFQAGKELHNFEANPDTKGLWDEVWSAASTGSLAFRGGEILVSATPAMTLIDVDGDAAPRELALAAVPVISRALRWFDLGGSIGIDFPTLQTKTDRRAVDEALAEALADWPHERTAMNGFGFVQLVARLEGPSLLHRFAAARVSMCARAALRRAELVEGPGALLLTVHPAIRSKLKPEWLEQLARRSGKQVRIETNPALALEAAHAQMVGI